MNTIASNYGYLRKLSLGLEQGKIVCFIGRHDPQWCGTFAHKISANFAHAIFDDVIVRYDMSPVADDEAGSGDVDHLR